jgi:hypothetical protein
MPKYVIERDLSGAGNLSAQELQEISAKSCSVIQGMGPTIQWNQSFITGNKIYCEYIAENEEQLREHAEKGGFPVTHIAEVKAIIDPTSAE